LNNVRNDLEGYYLLGADIDMNVSPYNEGEGWEPIGDASAGFLGNFDGNNHTINNLYINRPETDNVGLFGYIISNVINNVKLEDVNVIGQNYVGGLVGMNNQGTIFSSNSIGNIYGIGGVIGGLVGYIELGEITNCFSNSVVTGRNSVGTLIGSGFQSIVVESYSTGSAIGEESVGGMIGLDESGTFENCYSLSNITRISDSSETSFGGFIGYTEGWTDINNSYSIGRVIYEDTSNPTNKGFSGDAINGYNNFWDMNTSLQTTSDDGAIGLTTEQMKDPNNFTDWDFDTIWDINEGTTYPYLRNNIPSSLPQ
jgi:hypothetical protein